MQHLGKFVCYNLNFIKFHCVFLYFIRAFWGRIESTLVDLPINYKLNKPKLGETTHNEYRSYAKSPEYSVNWLINDNRFEVINARTGKVMDSDKVSRLAKQCLFSKYTNIMKKLPNAREIYHVVGGSYHKTKQAAENYQVIISLKELLFRVIIIRKALNTFFVFFYLLGC